MSLRVEHLVKVYGRQRAVDDLSFEVEKGRIVGFLGPNGAGKSTTMKMITGFLTPDEGRIFMDEQEVTTHALRFRRSIGYLAEHNPLYPELYVHEYLRFAGGIMGLSGKMLSDRVTRVIGMCGLGLEQHKRIEMLSKGYRQRVGLAQALLHDPAILILDEPTSGLDPNQLTEIRNLILEVGQNKTVILSTHILQEVEAICQAVVVINRGRLVANTSLAELLRSRADGVIVDFGQAPSKELLLQIPGIRSVEELTPTRFKLSGDGDLRGLVFRFAADHQLDLLGLKQVESLESIFQGLTTKNQESA